VTGPKNARSYNGRRFYTYRGQQLESVTSLLNRGFPKDFLKFWSAKHVAEFAYDDRSWLEMERESAIAYLKGSPWRTRDKAGDHGTAVHEALAALARGAKSWKAPAEFRPHVKAVGDFWRAYRPQPIYVESQIFSMAHGYAGSFDLLAWIYGRLLLIDAKTSSVLGHDMRLQLAAYRFADFIGEDDKVLAPMPTVHGAAILWIPRDLPEQWQLIEVKADRDEFAAFLRAKETSDFMAANEKAGVGELILPQAITPQGEAA
jgi:hypothetical protein